MFNGWKITNILDVGPCERDTATTTAAQRQLTIDDLNSRLHHALSAIHDLARTADPYPRSPTT